MKYILLILGIALSAIAITMNARQNIDCKATITETTARLKIALHALDNAATNLESGTPTDMVIATLRNEASNLRRLNDELPEGANDD